jgi:protein-tyrosine kinase
MSRLSEAFERAGTSPSVVPAAPERADPSPTTDPSVPKAWQFEDVDVQAPPVSAGAEASREIRPRVDTRDETEPERNPGYRFDPARIDMLVVGERCQRGIVEQYRRLAAVFHQAQVQQGTKSIMIASAVPSEGKTLTATNLALTFSHSYKRRVLLIDADLRRPGLHTVFGVSNQVGLRDSLTDLDRGPLPLQHLSPNLWLLTAGRPDPDPMSGLVSQTMKQLLAEAVAEFDWVIVDTPPVGLMPDANLLAGAIDSALLVVSAKTTPYPLARRAMEAIGPSKIMGVVLNRTQKQGLGGEDGDYYEYYGHYGQ